MGLLDLEEERRKSLASASPNSIAGLLGQTGVRQGNNLLSMSKDYFANLPQTVENNQRQLDRSMAGMFKTDMGTGQPNPAYYPEAINEVTQMMPGLMGATAFHGSPYRFDKFDAAKIGTGQGAQLRGQGMYFAEDVGIASPYSKIVPSGMSPTPNRQLFGKDVEPLTPEYKVSQLIDEMGVSKAKKFVANWAKDPSPDQVAYVDNLQSIMANVSKKSDAKNLGASNIYKVDIPDEKIPQMLDYDKPLREQPQFIQNIALTNSKASIAEFKRINGNDLNVKKLENIYDLTGADFMSALGGKGKAEKILQDNGVYGIKYAETPTLQTTKSGKKYLDRTGEGTSNYVVFDPTDVKILERNKKKVGLLD